MVQSAGSQTTLIPGTTLSLDGPPAQGDDSKPVSFPGPILKNGLVTKVEIFTPSQLANYPELAKLQSLINAAFAESHSDHKSLPRDLDRLVTPTQLLEELGNKPSTYTYVVSTGTGPETRPLATVSIKHYTGLLEVTSNDKHSTFKRTPQPVPENVEQYEMNLMVVDPSTQKQGLAAYMMNLIEAEAKTLFDESNAQSTSGGLSGKESKPKELHLILSTIAEINEVFYQKRGFQTSESLFHGPGTFGSELGFTVCHMWKKL